MDHLLTFKYMAERYPRVPLLSEQPYDGLPFDGYHTRQGFDANRLYNRDFTQHPREKTASFLQTWLFFGTIHEILGLGQPYNLSRFVDIDDLGFRVCTQNLDRHITDWAARLEQLAKERPDDCRSFLWRIGRAQNTLNKIYLNLSVTPDSPVPWEVTLSLGVLGCTFDYALRTLFKLGRGRTWGLDTLAVTRMMEAGWCPRDIAISREFFTEIPMFCASYMERRTMPFDHWDCAGDTCRLNYIDETTYVTQHREKGCQCEHVYPDQSEILRILDQGEIPVICLTSPGKDAAESTILDVKVKAGSRIHSYIAVSHVWSDGLGNPTTNSLPLCQLQFLYERLVDMQWDETINVMKSINDDFEYDNKTEMMAVGMMGKALKALAPSVQRLGNPIRVYRQRPLSIWIDTLCVPLDPQHRKLAISRMKEVYAMASMTIVLDSELLVFDHKECPDEELAIRLGLTGWMRRAWTFQEGYLSTRWLRFLFRDGPAKLPLWKNENLSNSCTFGLTMPSLVDKIDSVNSKLLDYAVKHGGQPYMPPERVPKSRLEEMATAARAFSLKANVLEEAKGLFLAMRFLWKEASMHSPPDVLVPRMMAVWNTLRLRETSREADKFLCFALSCALGSNQRQVIQDLLALPAEERMKGWVRTQPVVPSELLFIPGERYSDLGFKWVPKGVYRVPMEDDGAGVRDKGADVLVFKKPGFVLLHAPAYCRRQDKFVIADTDTGLRYMVSPLEPRVASGSIFFNRVSGTMAVILRNYVGQEPPEMGLVNMVGALLDSVVEADNRISGEYVRPVKVGLYLEDEDDFTPIPAKAAYRYQQWTIY
ncbi:hypothetical protein DL767_006270 [Monosporascus sp. MG133]|nr:hypothetical protein DL767_006270 [Monosporascus sp. MG133]